MHLPEHISECMPSVSPRWCGSGSPRWPRIASEFRSHGCMRCRLVVASCLAAAARFAVDATCTTHRAINGNSCIIALRGNRQREPRKENEKNEIKKKRKRGESIRKKRIRALPEKERLWTGPLEKQTNKQMGIFFFSREEGKKKRNLPVFHRGFETLEKYIRMPGSYSTSVRAKESKAYCHASYSSGNRDTSTRS